MDKGDEVQTVEMDCASGDGCLTIEWPDATIRFNNIGEYLLVLGSHEDGADDTIMKAEPLGSAEMAYVLARAAAVAAHDALTRFGIDADTAAALTVAAVADGLGQRGRAIALDARGGRFHNQELLQLADELDVEMPGES